MELDPILPKLYVGSYPRYDDIDTLKRNGVTVVLNVQSDEDFEYLDIDWSSLRAQYFALGLDVYRVPIRDFEDADLRDKLPEAVKSLEELLEYGHTVYVHCNAGVNRRPSVVLCYLHWSLGWSLDEAGRHLQKCHPSAPVMEVIRMATWDRGRR